MTICDAQKLCSAEKTIFAVFSAKHSFAEMKECKLPKTETYQKLGPVANMQKLFFIYCFRAFCFFLIVFDFVGGKSPPKAIFLQF